MGQLASAGQLRMTLVRRALVTIPLVVLVGFASGALSGSGSDDPWFASLSKPAFMPPGWAFPVAWTILYTMQGLALAIVWQARGTPGRAAAATAFFVQLALNLVWSPLFFGAHQVHAALWLIGAIFVAALVTTILFARIRRPAALLMLPYLGWLLFASALNYRIDVMNPDADALAPAAASTQITL
jgi:tryptophan-rich sensory protein